MGDLVLEQVHYWVEWNRKNNRNFHEGRYWTYNIIDEWNEIQIHVDSKLRYLDLID